MLPSNIRLHKKSGILELQYADQAYELPAEFLRVYSPSAEVRGHGPGQEVLQYGKKSVRIIKLDSVGNYALRPYFDDSHNTGIYTWEYLRELCLHQQQMWTAYLGKLKTAGKSRDSLPPDTQAVRIFPLKSD